MQEVRNDRNYRTEARSNLYRLIDETAELHQLIVIMGKRNKAALVSDEDRS